MPDTISLIAQINATVSGNYRFSPQFSTREIADLIFYGSSLGLDPMHLHDFICTGCRKHKPIPVKVLKAQMRNYQQTILPRGYPYCFYSMASFCAFKTAVENLLEEFSIPIHDVRIHGSSLRTTAAKDVDLLVVLEQLAFARFNGRMNGDTVQHINQRLEVIGKKFGLGGVDMLVVESNTYYPNRPYLAF